MENPGELRNEVKSICREAGRAILDVYERAGAFAVATKQDDSPLTEADLAAHRILVDGLNDLVPRLPVLSEESDGAPWEERRSWQRYWLVDPLDGTREFINRNGEFTVNVALIDKHRPVMGVVYVPVLGLLYSGAAGNGAFREEGGEERAIRSKAMQANQRTLTVCASRSHRGEKLEQWIQNIERKFPDLELISMGSSLKICLVAEGKADIYPRLGPTSEWDTAAAQAVLEAAGGILTDTSLQPFRYNRKENILNPEFYAIGDKNFPWREVAG